jgi:hypothetical protein
MAHLIDAFGTDVSIGEHIMWSPRGSRNVKFGMVVGVSKSGHPQVKECLFLTKLYANTSSTIRSVYFYKTNIEYYAVPS